MISTISMTRCRHIMLPVLGLVLVNYIYAFNPLRHLFGPPQFVCGTSMLKDDGTALTWRDNWQYLMDKARTVKDNNWAAAEIYSRAALNCAARNSDHSQDYAYSQAYLAYVLVQQERYAEAETLQRSTLDIYSRLYPAGDFYIADAQNNLANTLFELGEMRECRSLLEVSTPVMAADTTVNEHDVARSYRRLAQVDLIENDTTAARAMAEKSLEINAKMHHDDYCSELALSQETMATVLTRLGYYGAAENLFTQSMPVLERNKVSELHKALMAQQELTQLMSSARLQNRHHVTR